MNRRVLMIAAAFPPTGGPGVQRALKFAKYLPAMGWTPVVFSMSRMPGLPMDSTLLPEIPESVSVLRVRNSKTLRSRISGLSMRTLPSQNTRSSIEFLPWAKHGLRKLPGIIEREGISAIFSTFSPAANHWLAMCLKEKLGVPWIADFRDLWIDDCRYRPESPKQRNDDESLQRRFLESADCVLGVSPTQTLALSRSLGASFEKFTTITNGFDPDDFEASEGDAIRQTRPGGVFTLVHVGRLDQWRTTAPLVDGLADFCERLGEQRCKFRFKIVGHCSRATRTRLADAGIPTEFHEYVPHRSAIAAMRSADLLLLALPEGVNALSVIAAKLFEYLAVRRPILVVGPVGGECQRIVQECQAGFTPEFDARSISDRLSSAYHTFLTGEPINESSASNLLAYSRIELTRRLANLLDVMVARTSRSPDQFPSLGALVDPISCR